jgi:hypothetical protein
MKEKQKIRLYDFISFNETIYFNVGGVRRNPKAVAFFLGTIPLLLHIDLLMHRIKYDLGSQYD